MYALVDCNNFFASCERVFNPFLMNKAVVVLSNNDGCVVARSNEAKALGIQMGTPAFQLRSLIEHKKLYAFSSNYALYGDMSARIMSLLSGCVPEIEIYSIDEAFLNLTGIEDYQKYGQALVRQITKGTGIPISIGIAPTKTLAKIANHFAKQYKSYHGTCVIDTPDKRLKALQLTPIGDVWGIGCKLSERLLGRGILTAYDFVQMPCYWVQKTMTITGARIWHELQGTPQIDLEHHVPDKQQICVSRSFGRLVSDFKDLSEAVATYAATAAQKLRRQNSCACSLMVFIHTSRFRKDLPQAWKNGFVRLKIATSDTMEIVEAALKGLSQIYQKGYQYKKAGVILTEIISAHEVQTDLFDTKDRIKSEKLMQALDGINKKYGHSLRLAAEGYRSAWGIKREMLSPCYSTKLDEIIHVHC